MKEIILNVARQLAYWSLNIVLKQYMKLADANKDGNLSEKEIKNSIKELQNFIKKFRK